MAAAPKVNYDLLEPDWRAGLKTPYQMADEYTAQTGIKVSRTAIVKHFEKLEIPRNLAAKIQAKADAKVAKSMVADMVAKTTESAVIEANADIVATIHLGQRADIRKARALSMTLLDELEASTEQQDDIRQLAELLSDDQDEDGPGARDRQRRRQEALERVMSLPGRTKTMKELADTLKTLVTLEREAYGINALPAEPPAPPPYIDPMEGARRIAFILQKATLMIERQE
jgi:hypothetical protein